MTTPTELAKNRIHRAAEAAALQAITNANIPPTVTDIARRARLTTNLTKIALTQLAVDHRVTVVYDDRRQCDTYVTPDNA